MNDRKWKTLDSKIVYENNWLKVREDKVIRPDGKEGIYGVVDKNPGVVIIAMDEEKNIYFIEQERYSISKNIIELPAGATQTKYYDEDAKRELKEELNIEAEKMELIGTYYPLSGHENTMMYVYLATKFNPKDIHLNNQEGDEGITNIFKVSINDAKDMIRSEKIQCGITLSALNLFFIKYNFL